MQQQPVLQKGANTATPGLQTVGQARNSVTHSDWDADAVEPLLGSSPDTNAIETHLVMSLLQEHKQQTSPVTAPPLLLNQQGDSEAAREEGQDGGDARAVVFGVINTLVGLPALVAFASIVFQSPVYSPYVSKMAKMFFFSSAIHQLSFTLLSSLPFAVGQVQDVGLIFLSAMATSIASITEEKGLGVEVALGTTLITFAFATLLTGFLTVGVGWFKVSLLTYAIFQYCNTQFTLPCILVQACPLCPVRPSARCGRIFGLCGVLLPCRRNGSGCRH